MGEAPGRDDGTVTRSAEVTLNSYLKCPWCECEFVFGLNFVFAAVKYVGSFPVDDRCLDDQIELLHTQLKALKVSETPAHWYLLYGEYNI